MGTIAETTPVRLSHDLVDEARKFGKAEKRSPGKQIEFWAEIGKMALAANPNLPVGAVREALIGHAQVEAGLIEPFEIK